MLINTLFLSKPLTETDYSGKTGSSEKLFGFLFSEIMNVNNESEKLSLIPDHIGGNLIDYKSVFINYNFESNVLLSNLHSKHTKDPIVSLSKLFFENEILDNQKLNESEKVIYTPQQFVDSFTQLIKSILDNNNDSSKVELKLFSKNFILSQNVDNSHLQNIEKYLIKTIENEPVFSLTLSAFDKQILFEVFSQVVPSILNKETTLTQSVNLDKADENLLKISSINSIQSIDDKNTENSLEIVNTEVKEKTTNDIEARSIIANNDDAMVAGTATKLPHLSLKNNEPKEPSSPEKLILDFSKNLQAKNVQKINDNELVVNHSVEIETIQDSEKNDQINLGSKTSSENIAAKSNNIISVQSSKAENKTYQSEPKNFNELKEINTQQTKSINSTLKNEAPSVNNSGNTQIKIIIQDTNQNSNQVNSNDTNVSLSKISSIIKNTLEQSPIEITAKIGLPSQTEQNSDTKNVIEQFSANNIISDRQTQNLFRSLSSNSFNVQRNLAQVNTNKTEQDLEQKSALSLSDESVETNHSDNSIEIKNTKPEKNDLNPASLKENKINTEIKVNKAVTQDFTVQSNLENSGKTNVEKPTNITVLKNNTKNFREDIEQNNALNHRTDNSELSIKQNSSTLKESALSPEIKVSRGITVDSSVRVKSNSTNEIKVETPENKIVAPKNSNITLEEVERNNTVNIKTENRELSIKQNSSTLKESALSPEIKVSRGITVDSSVRVKSEILIEMKTENPENKIVIPKNANNILEDVEHNNTVNPKTDNKELSVKQIGSTIKESALSPEIKVSKGITVDSTVRVKSEILSEIKTENPENKTATQKNTNNTFESVRQNNSPNYNQSKNTQENVKIINNDYESENAISNDSEKQTFNIKNSETQNNTSRDVKTSSKIFKENEQSIIKNRKLNSASEIVKNSVKKTESNETGTPDILSSQKERITSENRDVNYSKNHRDSSLLNNFFRVVNDKPAKGVSGINNNSIQEEKSTSGISNIVAENSKEIKVSPEKENTLINETPKTDNKTNLYSQQEQDNSKNSNQQYNQTLSKENPSLNNQAEHSNDFRDTILGFEKKAPSFSSRTNSEVNLSSNKFDFSKFLESKSLENFVRNLNDNNLNYRAELNNLAKNNNSVELRLYPEELGRVKIIIDNADNVVSARIEVQSEQAKNIILSSLPQLRDSLKQEGLNTQNLNVYLSSEEQKGQNGANQKRKNNNNKMTFDTEVQTEEVKIKNLGYNTIEYLA